MDKIGNGKTGIASVARSKWTLRDLKVTAICAFYPKTPRACVPTCSNIILFDHYHDSVVAVAHACGPWDPVDAPSIAQIGKVDALAPLAHALPSFTARPRRPEHRMWHFFQHLMRPMLEPLKMLEVLARVYYYRDYSERPRTFLLYLDRLFATIPAPSGGRTGIREPGTPEGIVPTCYYCTT